MIKSHLKDLMRAKGLTVRSLASVASVATKTVEKARTDAGIAECRLSTLARIADALGVDVKDLFERGTFLFPDKKSLPD